MEAFSSQTGTTYPDWDALVAAEANGWLSIALITGANRKKDETWPYVEGPFPTKREAVNASRRMRNRFNRDQREYRYVGQTYRFFTRPAWKGDRG